MEQEVVRIQVVPIGGNKKTKSDLVITDARVYAVIDKGIFGHEEVSIPIQSVDSVLFGWKRFLPLLAMAAFSALGTLATLYQSVSSSRGGMGPAFVSLIVTAALFAAFWFFRPRQLLVTSGNLAIGGKPKSADEAKGFVNVLCATISGDTATPTADGVKDGIS